MTDIIESAIRLRSSFVLHLSRGGTPRRYFNRMLRLRRDTLGFTEWYFLICYLDSLAANPAAGLPPGTATPASPLSLAPVSTAPPPAPVPSAASPLHP